MGNHKNYEALWFVKEMPLVRKMVQLIHALDCIDDMYYKNV